MYLLFLRTRNYLAAGLVAACLITFSEQAAAQSVTDTLRLSLPEMEKRFLDSNLLLLASHYNVDAQKALIQQARLWDNPVLNTDQLIAANGKFFPYGKNPDGSYSGQYYIQLQQLIKTAGKRSKQINLATTNSKLSELQLQDVLRNLRYQLRIVYYNIIQQLGTRNIYESQLQQLNRLLTAMRAQWEAGNIALKDLLRIQSLVISLEQDITELDKNIAENQSEIKTLLQLKNDVFIKPADNTNGDITVATITDADMLFTTARQNNPSFILQQTQIIYQQQNLAYQKALRSPDITVGPNFDRNSSFAPNYIGLGLSLPLPILNKNQGNIKSAEYNIKQQQSITANAETELKNNIYTAYHKWLLTLKQDNVTQKEFYAKYEEMYRNILQSYRMRQISLLEFLDFFNEYTASQQRLLQQHLNRQLAKEEVNYHTGIDIIK